MSYRSLLKRYIAHVEAVSDATWLYSPDDSQSLSLRDLLELRALHEELLHQQNQQETEPQNYNNYAREVCTQLGLDFVALASHLAWPQRVTKRWLLDPDHPEYRAMSQRDYQHLLSCLSKLPKTEDNQTSHSG